MILVRLFSFAYGQPKIKKIKEKTEAWFNGKNAGKPH